MTTYRIAVIPGDMIGPEVVREGVKVLTALQQLGHFDLDLTELPWGAGHYLETGVVAPASLPDILAPFDAVFFGAHGIPDKVPDRISGHQLVHRMRTGLQLNVNLRPLRYHPGTSSPLARPEHVDYVIVRENTEGEYSHIGGRLHAGTGDEMATELTVVTRRAAERVMRYAFDLSRAPGRRRHVTCVTKSNALGHSMSLWDEVFAEVAADYPDVTTDKALVDAMTMYLVTRPQTLDVLVTTNLMGDILSDEGAALTGSIGLAASANLNLDRRYPSVFEPCHGSAPDIAGRGIANPLAAILSAALMLEWLGEGEAAGAVHDAVDELLCDGSVLTPDLEGTARTEDVGSAVVELLTKAGTR